MKFWQVAPVLVFLGCASLRKKTDGLPEGQPNQAQQVKSDKPSASGGDSEAASGDQEQTELWSRDKREIKASLNYLLGEFSLLEQGAEVAGKFFEKSYDLAPNSYVGAKVMSTRLIDSESNENVLMEAKRMVLLYPKSVELRIIYARLLFENQMRDQAISQAQKAVEIDRLDEESHTTLIRMLDASKKKTEALRSAEKFVQAMPNSQSGNFIYASLLIELKKFDKAVSVLSRTLELDEHSPEILALYGYALEATGQTAKAVATFEEMFRLAPSDLALAGRVTQLYKSAGGLDKALAMFDRLSKEVKTPFQSIEIQRAYIRIDLGKMQDALAILHKASQTFPDSDVIALLLALTHNWQDQKEDALVALSKIRLDSNYFLRATEMKVDIYQKTDRYQEIIVLMESLPGDLELSREVVAVWARAYSETKNDKKALALISRYSSKDPQNPYFEFLRGVYLEKLGEIEEAIAAMNRTISLEPKNSSAMNFIAYIYAERGEKLDVAEALVKQALELKVDDIYYLDTLAWIFFKQGKLVEAEKILEDLVLRDTTEVIIQEHLADVKISLGKKNEGFEILRDLQSRIKEDADGNRIREKFKALEKEMPVQDDSKIDDTSTKDLKKDELNKSE